MRGNLSDFRWLFNLPARARWHRRCAATIELAAYRRVLRNIGGHTGDDGTASTCPPDGFGDETRCCLYGVDISRLLTAFVRLPRVGKPIPACQLRRRSLLSAFANDVPFRQNRKNFNAFAFATPNENSSSFELRYRRSSTGTSASRLIIRTMIRAYSTTA